MRRAPSLINKEATAVPKPPVPPASTSSLPFNDSTNRDTLFGSHRLRDEFPIEREISAGHDHQKHSQHFAIPEVVLKEAGRKSREQHRNAAVQQKTPVAASWRKGAETAREIPTNFEQHPHQNQHRGNAAFGGELKIDIVQVAVPTGWQRTRYVSGNV